MPPFNPFQCLRKAFIVVVELRRPFLAIIRGGEVAPRRAFLRRAMAMVVTVTIFDVVLWI